MKQIWLSKDECTGCGMCADTCPVKAITMKRDDTGFVYPNIDTKCIDCNLCEKRCLNRLKLNIDNFSIPLTYAAWSKDENTRFYSTSGGLFSELAKYVLECGGVVAGAAYNKKNLVEHIIINSDKDLKFIRQSKYIQSDTNHVYYKIKKLLDQKKLVAFCGAPCQVAALYSFLDNQYYYNLITLDFICRGVNSSKAYISWLDEIEKNLGKKVTKVWFKYKKFGWKKSPKCTRLDFEDGTCCVMNQNDNLFMNGYLKDNLYIRPSCGKCNFKDVPRNADITLADFWGIDSKFDDDHGVSMVLINNSKGKNIFKNISDRIVFNRRDFKEIYKENICFNNSVMVPKKSAEFLRALDKYSFSVALKKYSKQEKYFINIVKQFIRKIKRAVL